MGKVDNDTLNIVNEKLNQLSKKQLQELIMMLKDHNNDFSLNPTETILFCIEEIHKPKVYTIKEIIERCNNARAENTPEYRNAVRKTNEQIKQYELDQAKMYREADKFVANSSSIENNKNLSKKLGK